MGSIRCFFLEPTGRVRVKLRRYVFAGEGSPCSSDANPYTYHASDNAIEEELAAYDAQGYIENSTVAIPPHTDNRWPLACQCGYVFREDDEWQKFTEQLYKRADTGEEMTIHEAPAGAMWYAWWLDTMFIPQLEHVLEVKTPGGEWTVDGQSSNCAMKEDWKQERHHCWVISGELPNITAGKNGSTCRVGAGSIQCGNYHGFLRNGYLEDA